MPAPNNGRATRPTYVGRVQTNGAGRHESNMKRYFRLMLALVVGFVMAAEPACGQMGAIRRMGGMTTPSMNGRQLRQYADLLGLSEAQRKAAEQLLSGYEAEYLAAVSRLTELQQSMQAEFTQTGDFSAMQDLMGDMMKKFRRRTDTVEKALIDDLKALLTPEQLERWPLVERAHRRKTTINWGSLSGESVDMAELVEGLRLEPGQQASLNETLEQYAVDLDRELIARNRVLDEQVASWLERVMNPDMEKIQAQQKTLRESSLKILELNKRYARQIEGLLPLEAQGAFREKVKLASFSQVYRKPHVLRAIEAAEKFEGLDGPTREAMKNVRDQYARDVATANDAWAAAIVENEMIEEDGFQAMGRQFGGQLPENVKQAKETRDTIDKKAMESLKALLTEEQQKLLPDAKSRPEFDYDAATSVK